MGLISTFSFSQKFKSASRYNEILRVLLKYGFEDLVDYLEENKRYTFLQRLVPNSLRVNAAKFSKWEKMRLVCEELGPTFIKFGQILSNRPDVIPMDLVLELEKLQDNVPPMSEGMAKEVVEKELGKNVNELFAWFEPGSFASASMAQVHKVTLHSGDRVALKIQRPGIQEVIIEDIKVMYRIADILERRIPSLKSFDPIGLVKNFENSILKELDFINESINVQRFYNNLQSDKDADQYAEAPKVYTEFTTRKVLALEFISGIKIDRIAQLEEKSLDVTVIARRLSMSYYKQIFEYGFFHADPHPGNLLVLPDSHICFLDFGMMGSMLPRDIEIFGQLFIAVTNKNVKKVIQSLQRLSNNAPIEDMRALEFDINEFLEKYYVREIHDNEMSTILLELKDIIIAHGLKVPTHFFLFARSLLTLEGVVFKLDPKLRQFDLVRPFLIKSVSKNFDPLETGKKILNSAFELGNYMEEFPRDLKNAIRKINSGRIKVDISHKGIDPVVHTLQRVSKQLVTSFVMVALIIGSSLFIISEVGSLWRGISIIGIIGLVIAAILGFGMFNNIMKGDYDQ
jgi:ubiquinone biosynthesis protein